MVSGKRALNVQNMGCGEWARSGHKCYMFYDTPKSAWAYARKRCQSVKGDLTTVQSLDERWFVELQMSRLVRGIERGYWTGLNDQKTEGTYVWADGSSVDSAMIRWNDEPNDYHGNEDCSNTFNSGLFNDLTCDAKADVICELVNPGNVPCPSGWIIHATPSTNDCYLISEDSLEMTNSEATQYCVRHGTKLVTATLLAVNDAAEAAWINATLTKLAKNCRVKHDNGLMW
jgi:hypothetical protein